MKNVYDSDMIWENHVADINVFICSVKRHHQMVARLGRRMNGSRL